jgi:hypothetical protein
MATGYDGPGGLKVRFVREIQGQQGPRLAGLGREAVPT